MSCECGCGFNPASGRFLPGHNVVAHYAKRDHAAIFWTRVKQLEADVCWPFIGKARHAAGYGFVRWNGRTQTSHRVAYELTYGLIPSGLHVLHECDNKICCNPHHLHLGTQAQNMNEAAARKRMPSGLSHHAALPISFNGEIYAVATWARLTNIPYARLISRLKRGWTVERALTQPPQHRSTKSTNPTPGKS